MKKSSAKHTCKVQRVLVGTYKCYDISDPKDELKILTKIFERECDLGWYTEKDGSWAAYSQIRHNKTLQEAYKKAIEGDLEGLRTMVCGVLYKIHIVQDADASIDM